MIILEILQLHVLVQLTKVCREFTYKNTCTAQRQQLSMKVFCIHYGIFS